MLDKRMTFSHKDYIKFKGHPPNRAYLVAVRVVDTIDDVPIELLDYDITYEDGKYELDNTSKYIILFLFDPDNLNIFTTFRKYTDLKLQYYKSNINTLFTMEYDEEC
jgi:hypothetical protein